MNGGTRPVKSAAEIDSIQSWPAVIRGIACDLGDVYTRGIVTLNRRDERTSGEFFRLRQSHAFSRGKGRSSCLPSSLGLSTLAALVGTGSRPASASVREQHVGATRRGHVKKDMETTMRSQQRTYWMISALALAGQACSAPPDAEESNWVPPFGGAAGPQTNGPGAQPNPQTPGSAAMENAGNSSGASTSEGSGDVPLGQQPSGVNGAATNGPAGAQSGAQPQANGAEPGVTNGDPPAPAPGEILPETPALANPPAGPYFSAGAWRGYVQIETEVPGTTVTPADAEALPDNGPFCLTGNVAPSADYSGAARLVFNLNQEAAPAPGETLVPALTTVPRGQGLAFTFTRSTGAMLRVQLESPDGTAWCHSIPEVRGQTFVRYSDFNTECWTDTTGRNYDFEPIHSVVFSTPGSNFTQTAYGFCVAGLADASGVGQAPAAPATFLQGDIAGSLQEVAERAVVLGPNGKKYIVQNNAWGATSSNGSQLINYRNNSFTIQHQRAGQNGNVPVSFPSIYIGGNGYTGGDRSLTSRLNDNLPIRVSEIDSIPTRFAHNATNGDFNATYDVWFAPTEPTGEYQTATGAFLMIWTYKPAGRNAIGRVISNVDVGGQTWQLVAGRRGEGGDANAADANSPVISYIKQGAALTDYSFDLNDFIQDAVQRSQRGELNGLQFSPNLLLTDIFAGFEIWSGGANLSVTAFTAEVR